MKSRVFRLLGVAAIALIWPGISPATEIGKGSGTVTRYVLEFGARERALMQAEATGDLVALDAALAPGFELRRSSGENLPRATWLNEHAAGRAADATLTDLAVYEVGAYAIANFRLLAADGKSGRFIVDVWTPDGARWLLRNRFESEIK